MANLMCVDQWQQWLDECATRPEDFGESLRRIRVVHYRESQEKFSNRMYLESRIPVIRMESAKEVSEVTTDSLVRLRLLIEDLPGSDKENLAENATFVELIKKLKTLVWNELERRKKLLEEKKPKTNNKETKRSPSKSCLSQGEKGYRRKNAKDRNGGECEK